MAASRNTLAYRLTDFLVAVLILFPLLLGGLWIQRPGLKFELVDLTVPTLLVGLWMGAMSRRRGWDWRKVAAVRVATGLWGRWKSFVTGRGIGAIWVGAGGVGLYWASVALRRHWAAESDSFDLGIFTQALWSLVNGHGYVASLKDGINLFQDHQSAIFWAFAPLFRLWPRAETLLITQAFALASGGVAVYLLARQYSEKRESPAPAWLPFALPLLYWCLPAVRAANRFDFHPEVVMLPLFLFAIAGLQARRIRARIAGAIGFLAALACKESAGPVAAGIGLAWVLGAGPAPTRVFTRRLGWVAGIAGVAAFLVDVFYIPRLFAGEYAYAETYSHLRSMGPIEALGLLFGGGRIRFLLTLVVPLALLPFFGRRAALWAALPGLAMVFLSSGPQRLSPHFHYGIEPSVGFLWAACSACAGLSFGPKDSYLRALIPTAAEARSARLAWAALFLALLGHGRPEVFHLRRHAPSEHVRWMRSEVLPQISDSVSLSATNAWVPHLAGREWIQHLPEIEKPDTSTVDCLLADPGVDAWPIDAEKTRTLVKEAITLGLYHEVWKCRDVSVLQLRAGQARCLKSTPRCD